MIQIKFWSDLDQIALAYTQVGVMRILFSESLTHVMSRCLDMSSCKWKDQSFRCYSSLRLYLSVISIKVKGRYLHLICILLFSFFLDDIFLAFFLHLLYFQFVVLLQCSSFLLIYFISLFFSSLLASLIYFYLSAFLLFLFSFFLLLRLFFFSELIYFFCSILVAFF